MAYQQGERQALEMGNSSWNHDWFFDFPDLHQLGQNPTSNEILVTQKPEETASTGFHVSPCQASFFPCSIYNVDGLVGYGVW